MNDLLLDIVTYLTNAEVVQGDGVDIFRDFSPEEPDDIVIVYEYSGDPTALHETAVHRSLQIVARSKSAVTARTKATTIFNLLSPESRYKNLTEERWCQLYPRQTPFKIKTDGNNRHYYGFNLGITTYRD